VFDGQADGWPFAAADDLRSCARRANEIAVELAGRPLPTTGRDLDRVLGAAAASTMELSGEGEVLLAVLLAAGWLEQGGEWVPGEAATGRFAQRRMQEPPDGLMTVVHSPLEVVASTLYDTEGFWSPATQIVEGAQGRTILAGIDRGALQRALDERRGPDVAKLARGDAAAIRAALDAAPANEYLRQRVYLQLASAGKYTVLAEIAGEFAASEKAATIDAKASIVARCQDDLPAEQLEPLSAAIQDAIRKEPDDASLYYYLGRVWERIEGEETNGEKSTACYQKALELRSWGPLAEELHAKLGLTDAE